MLRAMETKALRNKSLVRASGCGNVTWRSALVGGGGR